MQESAFAAASAEYDCIITAAAAVTQNPAQSPEARVLEDCAVAIKDGEIAAVGPASDFAEAKAAERLDLGSALLMPGLVNAHTHASMTVFRGLADDLPLMEWLKEHIFPLEQRLTAEIVEYGALLGCAEMARTGTTAFADMYLIEDAVARAVDRSGMRVLMGEGIFAFPSPAYDQEERGFALVREQFERYEKHPRIRVAVMPHAVYTTNPALLAKARDLSRELGLPLHIHLSETETEVQECLSLFGKRPVAYCHELGLLSPSTTIAHGVMLEDDELDVLAGTGTHVAHNPKSNMKLASGVAPIPAMLSRGMLPGLGTDGAASNNTLNMFSEMKACALMHKVTSGDAVACPASAVFDMATRGSAACLGWPELGHIAAGAAADIVALDLTSPNLQPLYNPVSNIVYAASGHEVKMTMVHGRVIYKDGAFPLFDYPALLDEVRKIKEWALRG